MSQRTNLMERVTAPLRTVPSCSDLLQAVKCCIDTYRRKFAIGRKSALITCKSGKGTRLRNLKKNTRSQWKWNADRKID